MPRFPIFRLGSTQQQVPPKLSSYTPALSLQNLQLGIDNLRHDVILSAKFVEQMRSHIARLIMRSGNVESMVAAEVSSVPRENHFIGSDGLAKGRPKAGPAELKPLLAEMHLAA